MDNEQKERSIENIDNNAVDLFQTLIDFGTISSVRDVKLGIYVYEKIYWALFQKIFPQYEKKSYPCILLPNGIISEVENGYPLYPYEEGVSKVCISNSEIIDMLFFYYNNSPYWDTYTRIEGYSEEEEEQVKIANGNLYTLFGMYFPCNCEGECFFEKKCIDVMIEKNISLVSDYEDYSVVPCNECYVLKSFLLPHYFRYIQNGIKEQDQYLVGLINSGLDVLKEVFGSSAICIAEESLQACYFYYSDDSLQEYNWGDFGIFYLNKATFMAGKIIDDAILALDKVNRFLPDCIREGDTSEKGR